MVAVPSSLPSSDSQILSHSTVQPKRKVDDVATDNGVFDVFQKKPDLIPQHFRYQKYEANRTHWLMVKYFLKKNLYGATYLRKIRRQMMRL